MITNTFKAAVHKVPVLMPFWLVAAMALTLITTRANAQAPGLLWRTNVGARLFAVDAQTNVYANAGGTVIRLSSAGVPIQTIPVCPIPGIAERDSAGNFYFAGRFDGTQNFGGITLVGGYYYQGVHWQPGYPSGYLAKYGSAGNLLWAVKYGPPNGEIAPRPVRENDLLLDTNGTSYVAYNNTSVGSIEVARFNELGTNDWTQIFSATPNALRLGGLTASNFCFLIIAGSNVPDIPTGGLMDKAGNYGYFPIVPYPPYFLSQRAEATNAKPVIDDLGQAYVLAKTYPDGVFQLRKYEAGGLTELWRKEMSSDVQWTLARDPQNNIYLAGPSGMLGKYDPDGIAIWKTNYAQQNAVMIVDPSGNRFLSFPDGSVARIASDPAAEAPTILLGPQSQTVFVGDNVLLSVAAGGTEPLRYSWRKDGTNVSNATNTTLSFNSAGALNSGAYSAVVTNVAGAITSLPPAFLRVKSVQFYLGNQMLTNGTYVFSSPPILTIRSAFANGPSFYTLDGSPPGFGSTYYSGPFTLSQSATLRAIGYSADFFQSEEADTVNATVLVNHTLSASASAGGSVSLNPPGGTYVSSTVVTATAVPAGGWSFLYWLGDATGANPAANISMERDKTIHAVFGTTLGSTVAGNGQILLDPPGGLYPYGTVVGLTAVPQAGNYFGFWGNAATGNTNPLYYTITSENPTVSSIFGATPSGQAALTVLVNGQGQVNVNPRANVYPTNQSVTLTAVPDSGQEFVNWTGDASGTQNPLNVLMNQSKVITANFTSEPLLRADRPGLEGLTPTGFRLTVVSDPPSVHQILGSTNLSLWEMLGTVTNNFGEAQFTDGAATNLPRRFYKAAP